MEEISKLHHSVQKLVDESEANGCAFQQSSDADPNVTSSSLGDNGSKFLERIEGLQDKWEALSQIMEAQSQRVRFEIFAFLCSRVTSVFSAINN